MIKLIKMKKRTKKMFSRMLKRIPGEAPGFQQGHDSPPRAECGPWGELEIKDFDRMQRVILTRGQPCGWRRIQTLRAFRRAASFGLFAWRVVGLLTLHVSVCSFVRGGALRTFFGLGASFGESWGRFGVIWR